MKRQRSRARVRSQGRCSSLNILGEGGRDRVGIVGRLVGPREHLEMVAQGWKTTINLRLIEINERIINEFSIDV